MRQWPQMCPMQEKVFYSLKMWLHGFLVSLSIYAKSKCTLLRFALSVDMHAATKLRRLSILLE